MMIVLYVQAIISIWQTKDVVQMADIGMNSTNNVWKEDTNGVLNILIIQMNYVKAVLITLIQLILKIDSLLTWFKTIVVLNSISGMILQRNVSNQLKIVKFIKTIKMKINLIITHLFNVKNVIKITFYQMIN